MREHSKFYWKASHQRKYNDLPDNLNTKARMFADDCIVYRELSLTKTNLLYKRTLIHLQHGNRSREWTFTFRNVMCYVYRAKSPMTFSYRLKGTVLAEEETSKYLGVDLQNNLSWNQHVHVSRVTKKANSMLGFLRRNLRKASEETKAQAYMSMVRSRGSDQTSTTAAPSGTLIKETRNTKWRWCNVGRPDL